MNEKAKFVMLMILLILSIALVIVVNSSYNKALLG
jgi:hypothetical protein